MPRPINLTRLRRIERPFLYHRDWLYDSRLQFLWVWLVGCPTGYDRHPSWRRA